MTNPDRRSLLKDPDPEEEAVIARALEKRRREFTAVRCCARHATGKAGTRPQPVLLGRCGVPCWPDGWSAP
ncbi:hypothetical protein [Streptomyces hayashii]|uniref:hypothetical protein n=1 Tax=Streptomyces hayashii TaxID=2839966 RepID=UPI00403D1BA4